MKLETTLMVRAPVVQRTGRPPRADAPVRVDRPAATRAGGVIPPGHAVVVYDQLRALLAAAGYALDAATVAAAVGHVFAGVRYRPGHRAPGRAALDAGFTRLARRAGPHAMSALFAGLGRLCAERDLGPQALVAYRRALPYSLDTHDPVLIGTVRGTLCRLATNDLRTRRAAARAAAVTGGGFTGGGRHGRGGQGAAGPVPDDTLHA